VKRNAGASGVTTIPSDIRGPTPIRNHPRATASDRRPSAEPTERGRPSYLVRRRGTVTREGSNQLLDALGVNEPVANLVKLATTSTNSPGSMGFAKCIE